MPDILFPAGRMVGGNLDKLFPRTNADGTPKLDRSTGQPEMQCSFGYAIPKTQARWQDEFWIDPRPTSPTYGQPLYWGKTIYETGAAAHPNLVASPSFSWKITDGDSQLPNKKGKKPCDMAGYPGHWVIWFSQGWLPKRVNATGEVELPDGAIVPGYYIQVFGSVAGNKLVPNGTPGVYLNPIAVALVGEGERIASDVDTTKIGFGGAQLPPNARPVIAAAPQFGAQPAGFPAPGAASAAPNYAPSTNAAPGYAGSATASPSSATAAPVVPNPAILNVPAPRQMTAKAAGAPYEAFVAQGWTDDMLRQQGYML